MDPIALALRGILPPAAVALLCTLLLRGRWARLAVPLSVGLGFLAAGVALLGWPPLALDLEFKLAVLHAAGLALVVAALSAWRGRALLALRLALAVALPPWLLDFLWRHTWEGGTIPLGFGAIALAVGLLVAAGARTEGRAGWAAVPAWLAAGSLTAAALHETGSSTLAQLEGAWVVALGVLWARTSWPLPWTSSGHDGASRIDTRLPIGSTLAPSLLHVWLVLGGVYTAELPLGPAVLLTLATLAPATRPERCRGLRGGALALLAALFLGGAGLLWVLLTTPEDPYAAYR